MNRGGGDRPSCPGTMRARPQRQGHMWGGDGAAEDDNKGYVSDKMDSDTDKAKESLMGGEDL